MYDILQLNDMLVPELLDIAEQQNITNAETLEKQELIYKILDNQASMTPTDNKESSSPKPKRKRIAKPAAKKDGNEKTQTETPGNAIEEEKELKAKKSDEKKKPAKKHKEEVVVNPDSENYEDYLDDDDNV